MKQLIVLISTMILGIAIAALVLGFKTDAVSMADSVSGQMNTMITQFSEGK
ncbi:MAG: hypothetical protein HUJ80_03750 [Firmicutes bacterium]|nr:hypothetical protein [Bacillota bacterium]